MQSYKKGSHFEVNVLDLLDQFPQQCQTQNVISINEDKEYRILLPLTIEEYQIGKRWSVAEHLKQKQVVEMELKC
uniref:Phosphatidylinositol transfer protein N-terminal domain-containing protein n=1 Tax=Acrobeloides nanus TaxID=290746 RepID=A0A914EE28_9BILA